MLQLKEVFDSIIEREGKEAEAVLVIHIKPDGAAAAVNVAGVDKLMLGRNAITLTAAVKDVLATKLFTASKILEVMEEKGKVNIVRKDIEEVDINSEKKPDHSKAGEADSKHDEECFDEVKDFLTGLAGFILEHL